MQAATYWSCFTATFLRSLVRSRVFSAQVKQASELTDALIKENLEEIVGKTNFLSVEAAFAYVKRYVKLDSNDTDG